MFFRLVLAIPHFIWLQIFGVLMYVVFLNWFVLLFFGRNEEDLHSVVARYLRYQTHVYAYLLLLANPYPGFRGRPGDYPIDLEVDPADVQNRWVTFFRLILAIPAFVFASVLGTVGFALAFAGWFVAVILGRMPEGMRDLGAYCLRYSMQTYAYLFLVTSRYPTLASGSSAKPAEPEAEPEPMVEREPELGP